MLRGTEEEGLRSLGDVFRVWTSGFGCKALGSRGLGLRGVSYLVRNSCLPYALV